MLPVLAQMVAEGRQVTANVHITPMRASRALALRYLATKFGVDTEALAVRANPCPLSARTSSGACLRWPACMPMMA